MLTLEQCLRANRPLLFISCESDIEVLTYLNTNFKNNFQVFSTTFGRFNNLAGLLEKKFQLDAAGKRLSFIDALDMAYNRTFQEQDNFFETYVFLDMELDRQAIRKIKDIVSKHQLDFEYTVNLIFISQTIFVPPELERLSELIFFDLPDERLLREKSDQLAGPDQLDLKGENAPTEEMINNLKGLTLYEVEQAYTQSWKIYNGRVDLNFIREFKKGAISKTGLLSLLESGVSFDDIGGLSRLKEWIKNSYGGWTMEGKKYGLPLKKGVLLVGVPGTGKSLSAKSLGTEWGLPVIKFEMSKLFSSRVGESEQNMHRVLRIFENVSPVIVFIDELEKSMAGIESSTFSDAGTTARTMATFLSWMQDNTKPVFIVATANAISYVPPELVSRFDKVFFVNLPQFNERKEIIKIHLKKFNRDPDKFNTDILSEKSKDLSGREIEQCIGEALYNAFHEKKEVTEDHIISVFNSKPGIKLTMKERIGNLLKWVGWDPQRKNGIRADFASVPDDIDNVQAEIDQLISEIEDGKQSCQ